MVERVSSDHPTVETIRGTLEETPSGTQVTVPAADLPESVVRVVLEGAELFALPERPLAGEGRTIRGVYETPDGARAGGPDGDRLPAWIEETDVRVGGSVLVDVVEPSFLYGFRAPGETAVYEAREPPADSLQSIAESLEE